MIPRELQAGVVYDTPKPKPKPTRNSKKTWRNLLRPKYVKIVDGKIHVNPDRLNYSTQATLSSCGGPIISNPYILQINENSLYDASYYKNNRRGYQINSLTQFEMLKDYFRNPVNSGVYTLTAEIRNRPFLQIVNALLMHAVQSRNVKRCRWFPLYSDINREKFTTQDILVVDNIHDRMDDVKFSYMRDILYRHRDSVVFLLVDGYDPLEFTLRHLHVSPRMVLHVGFTRIPSYVRKV